MVRMLVTYVPLPLTAALSKNKLFLFHRSREISIGLGRPRHVARCDRAAGLYLLDQKASRKSFPNRFFLCSPDAAFKRLDEWRHGKEIIAADIQNEFRVGDITVKIGKVVDFGNGELEAAVQRVIVLALLPGRKDFTLISRSFGSALRCLRSLPKPPAAAGECKQAAGKPRNAECLNIEFLFGIFKSGSLQLWKGADYARRQDDAGKKMIGHFGYELLVRQLLGVNLGS